MPTINELLQQGFQLHRANEFDKARALYDQALAADPNHAETLNLLGLLSWQTGKFAEALDVLGKAIEIDRTKSAYFANQAEAYRGLGRFDEAVESYHEAIRLQPDAAVAHLHLGKLLQQAGRLDEAIASYERAAALDPQRLEILIRLGTARKLQLDLPAAEVYFRRAVEAHPAAAVAHYELGNVLQMARRFAAAVDSYRRALEIQPTSAEAACNLGNALRELGQPAQALEQLELADKLRPDQVAVITNLGTALQDLGRLDEAQRRFERAVELDPTRPEVLLNMGALLKDQGRVHAALDWFERALQARPDYAPAVCARGAARLGLGQFAEGWADYERRFDCPQFDVLRFSHPIWDGSPLGDRRLLVHAEQGFGDTMQFIRYLPRVRAQGEHVVVAAHATLIPLLERSGLGPVIDRAGELPPFDVHAPLMSLPGILGTRLENVPADVPYLAVEPARVERLRLELDRCPGFRIGIAWQGRPNFRGDRLRSIPLDQFAPLAEIDGVRLVSLQHGPGTDQLADLSARFNIVELDPSHVDDGAFLDIAAAMRNVDLVISSDTAVVHLAGALGVPVWVALSRVADWRWMDEREDSPWYPTMRLFRQRELGQWPEVFRRMATAVREKM